MRIPPVSLTPVRRAAARPPLGPVLPMEPVAAAPSATATAPQTSSVAMLVALAEVEDERSRRRRAARHAEAGLDALEALDAELAGGEATGERLRAIAAWSASVEAPEDPHLAVILATIHLRAQIELAKHDGNSAGNGQ